MNRSEKQKLLWQNPEYRKHMSDAHKGNVFPYMSLLGKSHKGKKQSEETKRKISDAKKGKNWNWKGGYTKRFNDLKEIIRRCFEYRQWRSDVFHRDGFICQNCGNNKGGNLETHHIKSLYDIIRQYDIKNLENAIKCEELWDINNGLTLCNKCHLKVTFSNKT